MGRLLHDSKAILADQLDAVARTSADRGFGGAGPPAQAIDLALLTDGLRAEREQGITIDVAYRYFATDRRSFILADCPGHVQYTKNTVTGASTADAVVVLIDARKGVLEQTRRHLSVLQLLRVAHVIVAVNKIDLVDFSEAVFREIEADVQQVGRELGIGSAELGTADHIDDLLVIPVSALDGDNVVDRSERTPWYDGPALLEVLETLPAADELESQLESFRFPVQLVIRPQGALAPDAVAGGLDVEAYRDYRAYAGQITEGSVKVGDKVSVLTPGQAPRTTTVTGIDFAGEPCRRRSPRSPWRCAWRTSSTSPAATPSPPPAPSANPRPTCMRRCAGSRPSRCGRAPRCWSSTAPARSRPWSATSAASWTWPPSSLRAASSLELNDIGHAQLRLAAPLPLENYLHHRRTGAFLVIDPLDGNTLAAGLVKDHPGDHEDERYSI